MHLAAGAGFKAREPHLRGFVVAAIYCGPWYSRLSRQGLRTRFNLLSGGTFRGKMGLRTVVGRVRGGYNRQFAILPIHPVYHSLWLFFGNPPMRFWLLDRICSFEPDTELTAVKNVSLAEEYLGDHFPEFPVLPGVFMLEVATQASAWLVRLSENFAHSIVILREARSVKYADFVTPGHALIMRVEQQKSDEKLVHFRFEGEVEGRISVSGRLVLERYNLADADPEKAGLDARMIACQRSIAALLTRGIDTAAAVL
jgi:3-hydroxyacyl-[acyl-carrier-protein] dehydratase